MTARKTPTDGDDFKRSGRLLANSLRNPPCQEDNSGSALAYNLANFLRRLALPRGVKHWSLTTLREKLVKIGAKVTQHAKYVTFQMAEVAIPRQLFREILRRITRLRASPLAPATG